MPCRAVRARLTEQHKRSVLVFVTHFNARMAMHLHNTKCLLRLLSGILMLSVVRICFGFLQIVRWCGSDDDGVYLWLRWYGFGAYLMQRLTLMCFCVSVSGAHEQKTHKTPNRIPNPPAMETTRIYIVKKCSKTKIIWYAGCRLFNDCCSKTSRKLGLHRLWLVSVVSVQNYSGE